MRRQSDSVKDGLITVWKEGVLIRVESADRIPYIIIIREKDSFSACAKVQSDNAGMQDRLMYTASRLLFGVPRLVE